LFPYVSGPVPATKLARPKRNTGTIERTMLFVFFIPDLLNYQFTARARVKSSSLVKGENALVRLPDIQRIKHLF
jgi:hypothetical protein